MRFVYERITDQIIDAIQMGKINDRKLDSVFLTDNEWHQFQCEVRESGINPIHDGCKYMNITIRRQSPISGYVERHHA